MEDLGNLVKKERRRIEWRRLFITLAVGAVPTIIAFLFGVWWWGSVFGLITLFIACFALHPKLYPLIFTLYAVFAITWLLGSFIEGNLIDSWDASRGTKLVLSVVGGGSLALSVTLLFWFVILFVTTRWILSVSDSFDIPWRQAFSFVATRIFGTAQAYMIIENGKVKAQSKNGMLSRLGGPGVLIVQPGNAVALERGGKVTRILGPGIHQLKRFEALKAPVSKGIVDLRTQFASDTATNVLTRDGIPLEIKVATVYRIEPKDVTDGRPSSRLEGADATTPVLGGTEYPVYEASVRKAVYATTEGGWQGLFPGGAIATLRDVVAAYTLRQIFPLEEAEEPDPDKRTLKAIEDEVKKRFDSSWAGVSFLGFDIMEVNLPKAVEDRVLKQWTSRVEYELKVAGATAERKAMVELGRGRAETFAEWEDARLAARENLVKSIVRLGGTMPSGEKLRLLWACVELFRELASRVGQDETIAMRYIEAMQAIVHAEGPKSFVITPPNPSPGALPGAPQPTLPQTRLIDGQKKGEETEDEQDE
jgi:regulator of protease activity HflC (stomatin/prohibitin superfamily)